MGLGVVGEKAWGRVLEMMSHPYGGAKSFKGIRSLDFTLGAMKPIGDSKNRM